MVAKDNNKGKNNGANRDIYYLNMFTNMEINWKLRRVYYQ